MRALWLSRHAGQEARRSTGATRGILALIMKELRQRLNLQLVQINRELTKDMLK